MCGIENSYYELERSRNSLALRPDWVDPSRNLLLSTTDIPTVLLPFTGILCENLSTLMEDCGFKCDTFASSGSNILVAIQFPTKPRVAGHSRPIVPQRLHVKDQFSRMPAGAEGGGTRRIGAFFAADFGRLLVDARGETSGELEEPYSEEFEAEAEEDLHWSRSKDEGAAESPSQLTRRNVDGLNNTPLLVTGLVAVVWAIHILPFLF
ncbi:hypothetical protein C8R44DRAFT_870585 [Mycena epipterygia]|nr:hypothetical protein C8R44DRAFT_870585 [Mycena epipterygia]